MPTQLPSVPSLIPSSLATLAIGRDVSITIFTASSLYSDEKLFFGRGKTLPFQTSTLMDGLSGNLGAPQPSASGSRMPEVASAVSAPRSRYASRGPLVQPEGCVGAGGW